MAATVSAPDHLFNLRNNFFLGAYQAAINLSPNDIVERDCLVYCSYIAPGSYQLVIHEIDALHRQHRLRPRPSNCSHSFSPPPDAKVPSLIFLQISCLIVNLNLNWKKTNGVDLFQESTISSLKEWLADPMISSNTILRLIVGIVVREMWV